MKAWLAALFLVASTVVVGCNGNVFSLKVGDCFNNTTTENVADVSVVPCTDAHDDEVYLLATYTPDSDTYPGVPAVQGFAAQACGNGFQSYVGVAYADSVYDVTALYPSSDSWGNGDRVIDCLLDLKAGGQATGSGKGTNQ